MNPGLEPTLEPVSPHVVIGETLLEATSERKVAPGGLVTVAFLKAQLDGGSDHLGIFMPLVLDVLPQIQATSFATVEVQEAIFRTHDLAIPQATLTSLLKRAVAKGYLRRETGRFWKEPGSKPPPVDVALHKGAIERDQTRLADALVEHAARRALHIESTDAALALLFKFIEEEQVDLLLDRPTDRPWKREQGDLGRAVVAEFIRDVAASDPALSAVLNRMLEGLVLYHAAFQPHINPAAKRFPDLAVYFDSNLIRQALGYEGGAASTLMRETIQVLKSAGASCFVFDKTVAEIRRILAMYERKLATASGRSSLRQGPMARHFLTKQYSTSDVREIQALLEGDIEKLGLRIHRTPARVAEFTGGEAALTKRLLSPKLQDELEPRLVHDVDCVAGVLTLRKGRRSNSIESAHAVFATSSSLFIANARSWWHEDERDSGVEPVVHIRALANVAWLKHPKLADDFKLRELVALCGAAMRPGQATWDRFLHHLKELQRSNRLTSDEATAIVVSSLSEDLLRTAELESDDEDDIDTNTLDEIVSRVKTDYAASAHEKMHSLRAGYEKRLAEVSDRERVAAARAETAENSYSEILRRSRIKMEARARSWARRIRLTAQFAIVGLVLVGGVSLVLGHHVPGGTLGKLLIAALIVFFLLEIIGILKHVSEFSEKFETWLDKRFRTSLEDDDESIEPPNPWAR